MNPYSIDQSRTLARHAGGLLLLAAALWITASALRPGHAALTTLVYINAVMGFVLAGGALRRFGEQFPPGVPPLSLLEWTIRATALLCLVNGLVFTATASPGFASGARLSFYGCAIAVGVQALAIAYRRWPSAPALRPLTQASLGFGLSAFPFVVINTQLLPSWWLYGFDLAIPLLLAAQGLLLMDRQLRQLPRQNLALAPVLVAAH